MSKKPQASATRLSNTRGEVVVLGLWALVSMAAPVKIESSRRLPLPECRSPTSAGGTI